MQIISIGEVLWDVFGKDEFLGGAPLNFSAAAQRLGNTVVLLTAVGTDARGIRTLEEMKRLGLTTEFVESTTERATGAAIVSTDSFGNASFVIDRPAAFDCLHVDDSVLKRLLNVKPDWIYFGTLAQTDPRTEDFLRRLVQKTDGVKRFYDLNLRTGHWNLPLVQRLSSLATVLKLNDSEAKLLFELTFGALDFSMEEFCRHWSSIYGIETICVTLGSEGCAVFRDGSLKTFPGYPVAVADTVGAGDAFAAAFLDGLERGRHLEEVASFANALGALVASRSGATPAWSVDECIQLTARA